MLQAPKVTVFSDQVAKLGDTTQRPFVEAVTSIAQENATANQPLIRVLEEGTMVKMRAIADESDQSRQRIQLRLDLAMSEILDVEVFSYDAAGGETSVQIPKLQVHQVHLCSDVQSGESLLIDPFVTRTVQHKGKGFFSRSTEQKTRRMVLITPVWLDLSETMASK